MNVLLLLLASWIPLYGQLSLSSQAPPSPVVGAGAIGARGGTVLYYWVVARYPAGSSSPSTAAMALNTVGELNLTVSNFVRVSWSPMAGATGYDVIRSSSPMMPASCAACAVVLNTSSTTVDDTTPTGSAWPAVGIPVGVPVGGYLTINNRDDATPYLSFQLVSSRINELTRVGLISGTPANDDCIKYSAGRLVSAGAACGSGSGSGGYATIQSNGVAQTQRSILNLVSGSGVNISCADATTKTDCSAAADTGVVESREAAQRGSSVYSLTAGTSTAYTISTLPNGSLGSYTNGAHVRVKMHVTCGTSPTVDWNGLGAKPLYKRNGTSAATAISANECRLDQIYNLDYNESLAGGAGGWETDIGGASGSSTGTARHYYRTGRGNMSGATELGSGFTFPMTSGTVASLVNVGDGFGAALRLPNTVGNGVILHHILSDWTGSGNITVRPIWSWSGGGGGTGLWKQAIGATCVAVDQAVPALAGWNLVTATSSAASFGDRHEIDSININTTGCAVDEILFIHFYRDAASGDEDTTGNIEVYALELVYAKTL